jgi:hypothetical protein
VSTGSETFDRANLTTSYVLRNQSGEIVGANFTSVGGNLPDELTAGNRYRLENRVPATGAAVSAEVTAYRRP